MFMGFIQYKRDDSFTIITALIEQVEESVISKRHCMMLNIRLYCCLPFT